MRKLMLILSIGLFLPVAGVFAEKGHEHMGHEMGTDQGKSLTIKGELLDMACYMGHEGKGKKHKKCAETCILGGAPLGLLTEKGDVYLLVEDHAKKEPYESLKGKAAETVSVTGDYFKRGGVQAVVVKKVGE